MDTLLKLWDFLYQFFFIGVLGYMAKKWIADKLMKKGKVWINKNERNIAIWAHYQARAGNKGHDTDSVLDCDDQRCMVFKTYA